MFIRAFGTSANDGILRTMGPFRLLSTAQSPEINQSTTQITLGQPESHGEIITIGYPAVVEKPDPKTP